MSNDAIGDLGEQRDRPREGRVHAGATPPCVGGGGILIYNSLPADEGRRADHARRWRRDPQPPAVRLPVRARTIELVLFQDRTVALAGDDITLNGSSSQAAEVRGIVYAPQGDVKVNGSNSVFTMDQVIANTFKVNGSGGTINVLRETGRRREDLGRRPRRVARG